MLIPAAYGFRIAGRPDSRWLAVHGAERWPLLTLERDVDVPAAELADVDIGALHVSISVELPEDKILHPLLGRILFMLSESRGVQAMHGGALAVRDGAWAVIGPKEGGKSTLLGHCAQAGLDILSDDVLVLERGRVLAGPRCVDLREASAGRLTGGIPVRDMDRRRLMLRPVAAEVKLAGFIHLAWGPETALVPLAPAERLARLSACRARDRWPRDPAFLLDLAAYPTFDFFRPQELDSLEESTAFLLRGLGLEPAHAARPTACP